MAGVTVLAFGNGAPDIFTTIRGVDIGNTELVYNEIMGGGLFVTLFVVGMLCVKTPFRLEGRLFLRDCSFYIIAVGWSFWCLKQDTVSLWQSLMFLLLYCVYLVVIVSKQREDKKKTLKKVLEIQMKEKASEPQELTDKTREVHFRGRASDDVDPEEGPSSLRKAVDEVAPPVPRRSRLSSRTSLRDLAIHLERQSLMSQLDMLGEEMEEEWIPEEGAEEKSLVKEFLYDMIPVDIEEWSSMNLAEKVASCLKAPFIVVLKLVIPVVNHTLVKNGWSKLLNTLNCVIWPLYTVAATRTAMIEIIPGVPLVIPAFMFGSSLGVLVMMTSKKSRPPVYHPVFAFIGFFSSVVTVYLVASEVVSALNTIGVLLSISDTTLGITVLAWGNSVGDFITTLSLASAGYPRMGFAGCYGGPLFNLLLGLGLALTMKIVQNGIVGNGYHVKVELGSLAANIILYLVSGLVSALVILPTLNYEARASVGCHLLLVYFLFTIRIFLNELGLIHPLDTTYPQKATYPNGTVLLMPT
ncbi:mitochondrial sodium/calcium exchanger protein-like [Periplaneta americana]|uniref:mitochondrial sodium/calcium exchanger protein-like n=1 Tax=Periplaneta americana TaxID=6978 RepID=UPI0037E798EB